MISRRKKNVEIWKRQSKLTKSMENFCQNAVKSIPSPAHQRTDTYQWHNAIAMNQEFQALNITPCISLCSSTSTHAAKSNFEFVRRQRDDPRMTSTLTGFMEKRRDGIRLFCEASSIRGMSKIVKSKSTFLRCLWIAFVIFMTFFLFISVMLLVRDYLTYDVNVQTTLLMNRNSDFPAITICHHHPFSERAYELWRNGNIMSPRKFNAELRNLSKHLILSDSFEMNKNVGNGYHLDSIDIYYQSFNASIMEQMGHNASILRGCMTKSKIRQDFKDDCSKLDGFRLRTSSYMRYLNCHTVEPVTEEMKNNMLSLSIIVDLGPKPDLNNFEQGFINDIFDQAEGLRVVIHEPSRYADVMDDGVHVEPGKLNEITYEPVLWDKHSSPAYPCVNNENNLPELIDMKLSYNYTHEACISEREADDYRTQCNCIYALRMRRYSPTLDCPYCGDLFYNKENMTRVSEITSCLAKVDEQHTLHKEKITSRDCLPRCHYYIYEKRVSVTKWRTHDWQLRWMRQMVAGIDKVEAVLSKNVTDRQKKSEIAAERPKFLEYLARTNLKLNDSGSDLLHGGNFAFVVLKRKNTHLVLKSEKLVLSLNVLLSRIGGLCSLTIGLTAAFAVEIVEFIYTYQFESSAMVAKRSESKKKQQKFSSCLANEITDLAEVEPMHRTNEAAIIDNVTDVDNDISSLCVKQHRLSQKNISSDGSCN